MAGQSSAATSSSHHDGYRHDRDTSERQPNDEPNDDLEDALLMQAFMSIAHREGAPVVASPHDQSSVCAIAVPGEESTEERAFQFDPAATVFVPNTYVLPTWAQVIEDMYHDWDVQAFSWQGESRAAHFMTWFLAPGIQRVQCLYGRRIALFADFWNWREQFRQKWVDEIDLAADFELVYVSPPPTQLEAGIVGHVIIIQHNSAEWSSFLVSVFDLAINQGHPFHMAHSFHEQVQFREIIARVGYDTECLNHGHCQFRIRGQLFPAHERFRASDGDSVDLLVHRFQVPNNWYPPFLPHAPGAEGLALFQIGSTVIRKAQTNDGQVSPLADEVAREGIQISLEATLEWSEDDITGTPFTLSSLFSRAGDLASQLAVCVWEVHHGGIEIELHRATGFDEKQACRAFSLKHNLIKPCSGLFPVNFTRSCWAFDRQQWLVGSYAVTDPGKVIVACIEYSQGGATARVTSIAVRTRTSLLRSSLNVKFGTFVRVNGKVIGHDVELCNGDVLEYHVGSSSKLVLDRHCPKVQICLEAAIEHVTPVFDENADAVEILEFPELRSSLRNEDGWVFQAIPEGCRCTKKPMKLFIGKRTALVHCLYTMNCTSMEPRMTIGQHGRSLQFW